MAKAIPEMLQFWATRTRCLNCKHRFKKPYILPVDKSQQGAFQPNFNIEALFHMQDTHGLPNDIYRAWITGSIYGQRLAELGIPADQELAGVFTSEKFHTKQMEE